MPRKVALVAVLACLAFAAPAAADVVANRDADQVAGALAEPLGGAFAGALLDPIPGGGQPAAVGTTPLGGFATSGSTFAVLSSGDATLADDPATNPDASSPNDGGGGNHGSTVADLTTLRVDLRVPAGPNCLRLDLRFLSEEFPNFVGAQFNDAFIAELDTSDFRSLDAGGTVQAPHNFAFGPDGRPVTVNTATFAASEATGTTFNGATRALRASTPIGEGPHSVYLSMFDQGDANFDSAVFLDAMRLETTSSCASGTVDFAAPAVTISSPANGATLTGGFTYSGAAGSAPGDSPQVTVRTTSSTGQSVDVTATRIGTDWAVGAPALAPGTYTAVATQRDDSGSVGSSAPITFTVAAPPVDKGPPPPVTGKAVNVKTVKGKVRIKRPGGNFVDLGRASQIPTGSTVDTRKGTVELTSTAKGGKTQKARFFQGLFKVTQSRGKTPITSLTLNEKLARCSKKAKTSAKKKRKRRLWGDGKGNFRTSGRRSAATVTGTKWLVEDSCAGTLTRVARGTVKVRDFGRKKTLKVKAGHRYMAR